MSANIESIKKQLGYHSLSFVRCKNLEDKPTQWLAFWDDEKRVRVIIHEEMMSKIKVSDKLFLKTTKEVDKECGLPYTQHIICESQRIEFSC